MVRHLSRILLLWMIMRSQSIFYAVNYLQLDCLNYYLYNPMTPEVVEYCFHPNEYTHIEIVDGLNTYNKIYTFHELRNMNVTAYEILLWSASMDLAEQYQYYIDQQNNAFESNETFFNCTSPWFGSRCQYTFRFNEIISLSNRTEEPITTEWNDMSILTATSLTCYILLECNRGGAFICLDWREVCDGRVDCLNDGADEAQCFDLEINECKKNEYRCDNGLCVVLDASTDKYSTAKCLDRSDTYR